MKKFIVERLRFPLTRWLKVTEKGLEALEVKAEIIGREATELENWVKDEKLETDVAKRLHIFGAVLTIQPAYGMKEAILSAGILPIRTLISSFLHLGSVKCEYLEFLSKPYIGSPRGLLGVRPKGFIEVQVRWQLARPDAWLEAGIRNDCFQFDHPSTWKELQAD